MKETPQRLRSFAPPTRDKMILWSAIAAGCGIMALMVRYASINHIGTDEFTGNTLFCVSLFVLIGLYLLCQSFIENGMKIASRLFNKNELITETLQSNTLAESTETVGASTNELQLSEVCFSEETLQTNPIVQSYSGSTLTSEELALEEAYWDSRDWEAEMKAAEESEPIRRYSFIPNGDGCPSFAEYMSGKTFDEIESCKDEWFAMQPENIQQEIKKGTQYFRIIPEYDMAVGNFSTIEFEERTKMKNGKEMVEVEEHPVYISANGGAYMLPQLEEAIAHYERAKQNDDIPEELREQHLQCEKARKELEDKIRAEMGEKYEFVVAYIVFMMAAHLHVNELEKLKTNTRNWISNLLPPPFTPMELKGPHLTVEDLQHLGYNVGRFFKMDGEQIANFVKNVFVKSFQTLDVNTIKSKLTKRCPQNKDSIPLHDADQMRRLFKHYQVSGKINLSIIGKGKFD